jgi:hypothetical protein
MLKEFVRGGFMGLMPTIGDLKKIYANEINNKAIDNVAYWIENNHGEPFNAEDYLKRGKKQIPIFKEKMNRICKSLHGLKEE